MQEASTGITLQYGSSSDKWTLAEYCSVETNFLILPDEEFDPETRQMKEPEMHSQPVASTDDWNALGDLYDP